MFSTEEGADLVASDPRVNVYYNGNASLHRYSIS
jgi:hypothetical protein